MHRMRTHAISLLALSLVLAVIACTPKGPDVETTPEVEVPPTPTPVSEPVDEEVVVTEPDTATITSEEVTEELPDDIVMLNARGYLSDVFFATDRYDLSPEAREALAANARWLKDYSTVKVLLEGHCDERNTRDYNLALGERRAAAVQDYLVSLGVPSARIQTISYGEEKPFAQGHNEEAWKLNRRVHFVITGR